MGIAFLINQNIKSIVPMPSGNSHGVRISTVNADPESAVLYIGDSVGSVKARGNNGSFNYGSWKDKFPFNEIKPCMLKSGVVMYYLNPNDYTKKLDGSAADITSGNDGDVMIEFPKIYWKFETQGTDILIRYSDDRIDDSYRCWAHTVGSEEKSKIYISAYLGRLVSSKMRSLSGKKPTVSQTISSSRLQAQANGTGYDLIGYYQVLMLQILYLVMFKDRNSQVALGKGNVSNDLGTLNTGGTDKRGLFYGEDAGTTQMKFCGIEDFWGNAFYWLEGLYANANREVLIGSSAFNNTGVGYTNYGSISNINISGYIEKVMGGTETGFIVKSASGTDSTNFADVGGISSSSLPRFGGSSVARNEGGAFYLRLAFSTSHSDTYTGARIMYR